MKGDGRRIERIANLVAGGDRSKALVVINQALDRLGSLITLQQTALDLELLEHRYEDALKRLDNMLAAAPRKEVLLERKGDILVKAGRNNEARQTFQAALAAIEALPPSHRNRKITTKLEASIRSQLDQLPAEPNPSRS